MHNVRFIHKKEINNKQQVKGRNTAVDKYWMDVHTQTKSLFHFLAKTTTELITEDNKRKEATFYFKVNE